MTLLDLRTCIASTWSPVIGDPTILGWITVVCYVVAGLLSAIACHNQTGKQRVFWFGLAVLLLLLSINKELDLQTALTAAARCIAKADGWYADRRSIQITFIFAIIAISGVTALALCWILRRDLRAVGLALFGVATLLAFIAIRAAGFHHFDRLIGYQIGNVRMNWIMELGGIAMITVNALFALRRKSSPPA